MTGYKKEMERKAEAKAKGITLKELEKQEEDNGIINIPAGKKKPVKTKKAKKDFDFELVVKNEQGEVEKYEEEPQQDQDEQIARALEAEDTLKMIQDAMGS